MVDEYQLKVQAMLVHNAQHFDDFDFEDVLKDIDYVFSPNEIEEIRSHDSCAKQNEQLFFFLSVDKHKVTYFIEALKEHYKWLADAMEQSLRDESNQDEIKAIQQKIRMLHSHMPRLTDYNVHRLKYLFAIQKALINLEPMQCLILNGNLQFGKKWLAIDACSNYQVMRAMGSNVFYINLSNCHTKEAILEQMVLLYSMVAPPDQVLQPSYDDNITNKIVLLKPLLNEHLRNIPDCLLILCSVPTVEALDAFRLKCKIMLTTRNKDLQDTWSMHERIVFNIERGLTSEQSLQLFAKVLQIKPTELPSEAAEIDELCYGNPCRIWVVASNLKSFETELMPWRNWVKMLKKNESTCDDSFRVIIEQSLNSLNVLTAPDLERFYSLAIFDENAKIPLSLLQMYWGMTEIEVERMINTFDRLYLVDLVKQKTTFCTLQYHYWSYLSHFFDETQKRKMHQKLVECYRIDAAISSRTDTSLSLPDDMYLFFYIASHIRQAQMDHLLPILYLDLGFLEQKLRATGLPNTIGDLQTYRTEIIAGLESRKLLLNELLHFLPNVEEMLKKSRDTCLLQYALMNRGQLKKEAICQASQFKQRFFFEGSDHIYHHRQIVALPMRPAFIRFCAPNFALIAFVDHSIWLVDLSTGYTVSPTWFDGHKHTVCDIQMLSDDYFVSLDRKGICHVWSLLNTQLHRKRANSIAGQHHPNNGATCDTPNRIRQSRADSFDRHRKTPQRPQQTLDQPLNPIQCLTVIRGEDGQSALSAIFGTESGQILILKWEMNKLSVAHREKTVIGPIHSIVPVKRNLVVLSRAGILWHMHIKNMSVTRLDGMPMSEIIEPVVGLHELSEQMATDESNCQVLVVYSSRVFRVTFSNSSAHLQEAIELYAPPFDCNRIICSVLSDDRNCLILGTERGIVVYDMTDEQVILRRSVSDVITSVDIYSLKSDLYRYVLMCGTKRERFSYVYGLETYGQGSLMQFSPDRMGSPLLGDGQLNTWLLGGRLFAVTDIDDETNTFSFAGVDSRGGIHRKSSADDFKRSERIQCRNEPSKIQVLATGGDTVFVGCSDGSVYDSYGKKRMQLTEPVTYLRYFHEGLMVAGCQESFRMSPTDREWSSRKLVESYLLGDGRFVLLVTADASFMVYDLACKIFPQKDIDTFKDLKLGGCHLMDDRFAMASQTELQFFAIDHSDDHCVLVPWNGMKKLMLINTDNPAVCVRLSTKSEFCAVGFSNGLVQLYRLDRRRPKLVHQLQSHTAQIHALLFSPWTSDNRKPVILASVSEQLCFWNVTFAVNNPTIDDQIDSFSDRFQFSPNSPLLGAHQRFFSDADEKHQPVSSWIGKLGPKAKPELLACLKFNGHAAHQIFANAEFTRFLTIDDVGEIYFLKVPGSEAAAATGGDVSDSGVDDEVIVDLDAINMES